MGGIAGGLGGSIIEPIGGTIIGSYEGAIAGSTLGAITGTFLGSEVANSLNLMFSESSGTPTSLSLYRKKPKQNNNYPHKLKTVETNVQVDIKLFSRNNKPMFVQNIA